MTISALSKESQARAVLVAIMQWWSWTRLALETILSTRLQSSWRIVCCATLPRTWPTWRFKSIKTITKIRQSSTHRLWCRKRSSCSSSSSSNSSSKRNNLRIIGKDRWRCIRSKYCLIEAEVVMLWVCLRKTNICRGPRLPCILKLRRCASILKIQA